MIVSSRLSRTLHFSLAPSLHLFAASYRSTTAAAAAAAVITTPDHTILVPDPVPAPPKLKNPARVKGGKTISKALSKQNWLESLSCPLKTCPESKVDPGSEWVVGLDPDICGALAVLKPDCTVQVFDCPHLEVLVGKKIRKRLDARSIVQLLQSVDAPIGTTAFIEQSIPYPQDGKQAWWSGGFGYGLWTGILVASGFSVVPLSSLLWKNEFKLSRSPSSRMIAGSLHPQYFLQ